MNRDGLVDNTDVIGIKRWIARKVCDGTDVCGGAPNNCSGTWRFLFFNNSDPTIFQADHGDLGSVCDDQAVPIEGILLGDFDGSWPNHLQSQDVLGDRPGARCEAGGWCGRGVAAR